MTNDMVSVSHKVKLIESHTGAIKKQSELNSKLNLTDTERLFVPFNDWTYSIFGDGKLLNKNGKVAKLIAPIFQDARITPLSTASRTGMAIKNRDPLLYKFIRNLF